MLMVKGENQSVAVKCVSTENPSYLLDLRSLAVKIRGEQTDRPRGICDGKRILRADIEFRADCRECSYATIRSLIIDGNRPELLRIPKGGALVEIGNAEMQTVRDCKIYESR